MNHKNDHQNNNFWVGFAAGAIGASILTYVLGTKKGRDALGYILKHAEDFDNSSEELLTHINQLYELITDQPVSESKMYQDIIDKVKTISSPAKK
jgi:hypothetical protein